MKEACLRRVPFFFKFTKDKPFYFFLKNNSLITAATLLWPFLLKAVTIKVGIKFDRTSSLPKLLLSFGCQYFAICLFYTCGLARYEAWIRTTGLNEQWKNKLGRGRSHQLIELVFIALTTSLEIMAGCSSKDAKKSLQHCSCFNGLQWSASPNF